MKKILFVILLSLHFIAFTSCKTDIDGGCDIPIKLSGYEIIIPPEGGESSVVSLEEGGPWLSAAIYRDNSNDVEGQKTIFSYPNSGCINHDWFSIWTKMEGEYVVYSVKLTPNNTGFKRRIEVGLQLLCSFESFYVYQDPM